MKQAVDRTEALSRLTARWLEQCRLYPTLRYEVPLHLYVRENLPHVMTSGLLAEYSHKGE